MRNKALLLFIVSFLLVIGLAAQNWVSKASGTVEFEFPDSAQEIQTDNGSAMTYNQDKIYLTVTTLPDSTEYSPQTRLERSRYYAATAATATINLRGKMIDNRDTMIGEEHMYYTAVEVKMPDNSLSLYELMQYMPDDTLRAFTCQYVKGDKSGEKVRDRFFSSIQWPGTTRRVPAFVPFILAGAMVVFVVGYWGLRKNLNSY